MAKLYGCWVCDNKAHKNSYIIISRVSPHGIPLRIKRRLCHVCVEAVDSATANPEKLQRAADASQAALDKILPKAKCNHVDGKTVKTAE